MYRTLRVLICICLFASAAVLFAQDAAKLTPPVNVPIKVAFVLGDGATMIDFTGPWEVFQDVMTSGDNNKPIHSHHEMMDDPNLNQPFQLYTIAISKAPVQVTGGMKIVPDYTFADAPKPNVIVIPAQHSTPEAIAWVKKTAPQTDVTMSVCTGAFLLARTGLLDGEKATTHHWFQDDFEKEFRNVKLQRGVRYVENGKVSTSAGLTSGIDMALRVVERYYGHDVAVATAEYMEYKSDLWK
jgi:transcriptional regulator GlxA family with amidase domain